MGKIFDRKQRLRQILNGSSQPLGLFKQVEPFSVTVGGASQSSNTYTPSGDFNQSFTAVFLNGVQSLSTQYSMTVALFRCFLNDEGDVEAARIATSTESFTLRGTLVEFNPALVKAVYTFEQLYNYDSDGSTEKAVGLPCVRDNCIVLKNGESSQASNIDNSTDTVELVGDDGNVNILLTRQNDNFYSSAVGVTVVEFWPGVLVSNQEVTLAITGTDVTATAEIDSVDLNQAVLIPQGYKQHLASLAYAESIPTFYMSSDSEVTLEKGVSATSNDVTGVARVIELNNCVKSVQNVQYEWSSGTSGTSVDIALDTAVNADNSTIVFGGGDSTETGNPEPRTQWFTVRLIDDETVRIEKGSATTDSNCKISFQVVESYDYSEPDDYDLTTIDGLVALYDPTDPDNIELDGTDVTALLDKSGNGYHLAPNSGTEPLYVADAINGTPAIKFDGSSQYLYADDIDDFSGADVTFSIFQAYKATDKVSRDYNMTFARKDTSTAPYWRFTQETNGFMYSYLNPDAGTPDSQWYGSKYSPSADTTTDLWSAGVAYNITLEADDTCNMKYGIELQATTSNYGYPQITIDRLTLGAWYSVSTVYSYSNGTIGYTALFNVALDWQDHSTVLHMLNRKHRLQKTMSFTA